jgi:autoinducer 2-degrading protein
MHILAIAVTVKPDKIEDFREVTLANARGSRTEPGVVSFDVLQSKDDPAQFMIWEVYVDAAAHQAHRQTPHYLAWKAATPDWIEPGPRGVYDYAEKV